MSRIIRTAVLFIFNVTAISLYCCAQQADTTGGVTMPLATTSYTLKGGIIRAYFLAGDTGKLSLGLRSGTSKPSTVYLRVDNGKETILKLGATGDYAYVPRDRTYPISKAGYHFIELRPAKGADSVTDIKDIIFKGSAAKALKYNTSGYKGAPATHLTYVVPKDTVAAWFYSEISVPKEADESVNAYYETNGFSGGYMGIQHNSKDERRFIFSIWSNFKTDDYKQIPEEYQVKLIKKGTGVFTGGFGNEGSGGHSHLVFNWKPEVVYKLLVGAKPAGDHTIYTAYYYAPENGKWELIAQWDKTKTGGKLLTGLYSFVENFGDNGNDYFSANYGNQWICTPSGKWIELTSARFTTTADPVKHPRFDYGGGSKKDWFYMYSGGFKHADPTPRGAIITRQATHRQPAIDFASLPN